MVQNYGFGLVITTLDLQNYIPDTIYSMPLYIHIAYRYSYGLVIATQDLQVLQANGFVPAHNGNSRQNRDRTRITHPI